MEHRVFELAIFFLYIIYSIFSIASENWLNSPWLNKNQIFKRLVISNQKHKKRRDFVFSLCISQFLSFELGKINNWQVKNIFCRQQGEFCRIFQKSYFQKNSFRNISFLGSNKRAQKLNTTHLKIFEMICRALNLYRRDLNYLRVTTEGLKLCVGEKNLIEKLVKSILENDSLAQLWSSLPLKFCKKYFLNSLPVHAPSTQVHP